MQVGEREGAPRGRLLRDLRPLGVTRLADEVVEQIRRLIVEQGLAPGARLPSERDLAERLRASRAIVSQALRTLSLMGLVEVRRGSGAYVLRDPTSMVTASVGLMADVLMQSDEEKGSGQPGHGSVYDLAQVRLWLERAGATEALHVVDDGALEELESALTRLCDSVGRTSAWIAADTVFHATLVRAAGNPYLSALYESVHTAVVSTGFESWVRHDEVPEWLAPEHAQTQLDLHVPIVEALRRGDEAALLAAIADHHEALLQHLTSAADRTDA